MRGLFSSDGNIACRLDRDQIRARWTSPPFAGHAEPFDCAEGWGFVSRPAEIPLFSTFTSPDGSASLAIDGYLRSDLRPESASGEEHIRGWLDRVAADGASSSLASIHLAAFAMVIEDRRRGETWILSDPLTLVPLYFADLGRDGVLVSTRPAALAGCPVVCREIDWVAVHEWIYCRTPFGERSPMRGIRYLLPGRCLVWSRATRTVRVEEWPSHPLLTPYTETSPRLEEIFQGFQVSCRRHAAVSGGVAHFQSGGFDSRFILANWPGENPPCFTYGDPRSAEVRIARTVAQTRGSPFHHVTISPGQPVRDFDAMFGLSGTSVFHTRTRGVDLMRQRGHQAVLDGFLGDVLLGGLFYSGAPSRSSTGKLASLLAFHSDSPVKPGAEDRIAEWLYQNFYVGRPLKSFCSPDFVNRIRSVRDEVLDDIAAQVRQMATLCPTEALLVRQFKILNRSIRYVNIQGVHSRGFLEVLFPFAGDRDFLRMTFGLAPARVAYLKTYLALFRKYHPRYAAVATNHSLLPLGYPAGVQRLFESATSNLGLRGVWAKVRFGGQPDYISRDEGLVSDNEYREFVAAELDDTLARRGQIEEAVRQMRAGERVDTGVLSTLLAVARWMKMGDTRCL